MLNILNILIISTVFLTFKTLLLLNLYYFYDFLLCRVWGVTSCLIFHFSLSPLIYNSQTFCEESFFPLTPALSILESVLQTLLFYVDACLHHERELPNCFSPGSKAKDCIHPLQISSALSHQNWTEITFLFLSRHAWCVSDFSLGSNERL